jgi:hypothetical protein
MYILKDYEQYEVEGKSIIVAFGYKDEEEANREPDPARTVNQMRQTVDAVRRAQGRSTESSSRRADTPTESFQDFSRRMQSQLVQVLQKYVDQRVELNPLNLGLIRNEINSTLRNAGAIRAEAEVTPNTRDERLNLRVMVQRPVDTVMSEITTQIHIT